MAKAIADRANLCIETLWEVVLALVGLEVLPLDGALASGAVFAIVSGSDGRADRWKRFRSQLLTNILRNH